MSLKRQARVLVLSDYPDSDIEYLLPTFHFVAVASDLRPNLEVPCVRPRPNFNDDATIHG